MMTARPPQIVKFNVGGQLYQVSRSLFDMHPNIMLTKSISDKWHIDPEAEIFIDRNGDRFQFVLDYLRDDKISLPITLSKRAIITELEYYGIEIEEKKIDETNTILTTFPQNFKKAFLLLKSRVDLSLTKYNTCTIELFCDRFALSCFDEFVNNSLMEKNKHREYWYPQNSDKDHLEKLYSLLGSIEEVCSKVNQRLHMVGLNFDEMKFSGGAWCVKVITHTKTEIVE